MNKELEEVQLMIEQSQLEVEKLVQRNSTISAHIQQVQSNIDTMPRPDIRATYDAALETQQRLFVMRGQLEKLQCDKHYLENTIDLKAKMQEMFADFGHNLSQSGGRISSATAEKLEESGYGDMMAIAVATPGELVDASGVTESAARKMINHCRNTMDMGFEGGDALLEKRARV